MLWELFKNLKKVAIKHIGFLPHLLYKEFNIRSHEGLLKSSHTREAEKRCLKLFQKHAFADI